MCVVDDDQSVRESLRTLLRSAGFLVEAFASAEAFLAWPERLSAGCLVLDLRMPGMSGLGLQRILCLDADFVPTIVITATDDPVAHTEVLALGARAMLIKPFSDTRFLELVSQAMSP